MLKKLSHVGGDTDVDEILFSTPFGYLFPDVANSAACLLPTGQDTTRALLKLGTAMATDDQKTPPPDPLDSDTPSFFTYFGQFIDHDLTARTDRDTTTSELFSPDGCALPIVPRDPTEVATTLKNGRRPQLDLDNAYGDGPALLTDAAGNPIAGATTNAQDLFDTNLKFKIQNLGPKIIDLPRPRTQPGSYRPNERVAQIADARNDENINVSQLHAAFLSYHNVIMDGLAANGVTGTTAFVRARQFVRWTYQYLVVEEYLKTVCLDDVVVDILRNGPTFYGPVAGGEALFMPLEFSVAAFRFGHSMIRPEYELRGDTLTIRQILGVSAEERPNNKEILKSLPAGDPNAYQLKKPVTVDWTKFIGSGASNKARKIDPLIARGLGSLTFVNNLTSVMAHLAQRNLLRGFSLSIPTGQAVASVLGIKALTPDEIRDGESAAIRKVLDETSFAARSPLWYYILREAAVQTGGKSLGVVGSRIVAETIIGLLKKDPNSYINQYAMARNITKNGIVVPTPSGRVTVGTVEGFLTTAQVLS